MPKYLFHGSYTSEGVKGLLREGGSGRRAAAEQVVASVGGEIEALYFAFGEDDFFLIANLPDDETATAISLKTAASGAVTTRTVKLLTPEQVDEAMKKTVQYRPPGT